MASPLLRRFLSSPESKSRTAPCRTCRLRNRKRIEKEAAEFNACRAAGTVTTPWSRYVDHALKPHLGYPLRPAALLHHLRNCLGWTIH